MLKRPCYDELTKTDCPDRCAGCSAHCERWAEYVAARNAEYAERTKEHLLKQDYKGHRTRRIERIRKCQERLKRKYGRHSGG